MIDNEKGLALCDKCDYFISVEEAYQKGAEDFAAKLIESCSGYGYTKHDIKNKCKEILKESSK